RIKEPGTGSVCGCRVCKVESSEAFNLITQHPGAAGSAEPSVREETQMKTRFGDGFFVQLAMVSRDCADNRFCYVQRKWVTGPISDRTSLFEERLDRPAMFRHRKWFCRIMPDFRGTSKPELVQDERKDF